MKTAIILAAALSVIIVSQAFTQSVFAQTVLAQSNGMGAGMRGTARSSGTIPSSVKDSGNAKLSGDCSVNNNGAGVNNGNGIGRGGAGSVTGMFQNPRTAIHCRPY